MIKTTIIIPTQTPASKMFPINSHELKVIEIIVNNMINRDLVVNVCRFNIVIYD